MVESTQHGAAEGAHADAGSVRLVRVGELVEHDGSVTPIYGRPSAG